MSVWLEPPEKVGRSSKLRVKSPCSPQTVGMGEADAEVVLLDEEAVLEAMLDLKLVDVDSVEVDGEAEIDGLVVGDTPADRVVLAPEGDTEANDMVSFEAMLDLVNWKEASVFTRLLLTARETETLEFVTSTDDAVVVRDAEEDIEAL